MNWRVKGPLAFPFSHAGSHKLFRADGSGGGKKETDPIRLALARLQAQYQGGQVNEALFSLVNLTRSLLINSPSDRSMAKVCLEAGLKMYREKNDPRYDIHGLNLAEVQHRLGEKTAAKILLGEIVGRIPVHQEQEDRERLRMIAIDIYLIMDEETAAAKLADDLETEAGHIDAVMTFTDRFQNPPARDPNRGTN